MINFYQWLNEQGQQIQNKPVQPQPPQRQQQAPWSNVDISKLPQGFTNANMLKMNTFLEPCTTDVKGKDCQERFSKVNQYYKTTQNKQEKIDIKNNIDWINKSNKVRKVISRSLDVGNFQIQINKLAKPCYDKKPECQKNLKILQNGFNDPKQGKQGKEIIKKHLDAIQAHQQRLKDIQDNEKNTQAQLQGNNALVPQQPATNTQQQPNWIEVQKFLGDAGASKNLKQIQEIIQKFPNMPPELMNHAQNLVRILKNNQGK